MNKTIFIATILIAFASFAFAAPGFPSQFYGTVTVNGAPAADGTVVKAQIDGADVASTTASGGSYNLIITDPENTRSGKTVAFFVSGVQAATTAYCSGCEPVELHLSVTIASPPSGGSSSGGGGGGGSSGGGGGGGAAILPPAQTTQQSSGCQEKWLCGEWSQCLNGLQRRTCTDANNCGTNNNEPFSMQPCGSSGTQSEQPPQATAPSSVAQNPITGFLIANPSAAGAIIVAVLGVGFVGWRMYSRRRSKRQ